MKDFFPELHLLSEKGTVLIAEVGNPFDLYGMTRVQIQEEGNILIEHTHNKDKAQIKGKITSSEKETVFEKLTKKDFWNQEIGKKKGIPDEARMKLAFIKDGKEQGSLTVWASELDEYKDIKKVVEIINGLVIKEGKGKILFL